MIFLRLLPVAALLAGCASIPDQEEEQRKDVVKDPARIHGFFIRMIRERQEALAAEVTTLEPKQQLILGIRNQIAPDLTRRILLGFEQHDVKVAEDRATATVRWCNREFGISRDFQLISKYGGKIWELDITREAIEELARAGLEWFRKQREASDGRIYAYPPDWIAANVSATCKCGR
jgi:hypothetical protein